MAGEVRPRQLMSNQPTSPRPPANSWLAWLLHYVRPNELALVLSILAVLGGTAALGSSHAYVRVPGRVLKDNCRRLAPLGMLALGATVVIISGGIDLSVGSMAAFSGTIAATLMLALGKDKFDTDAGVGSLILLEAIGAALVTGLVVGTLHTWMITSLR